MEVLTKTTNFDFMRMSTPAIVLSLALLFGSIYLWFASGDDKYGIDFRGGNEFVVQFKQDVPIAALRATLEKNGFTDAVVQSFEGRSDEFSIRVGARSSEDRGAQIRTTLAGFEGNSFEIVREDFVGPVIGQQIRDDAIIATIIALLVILVYVTIRFNFAFATGAIVAIFHDAIIATGATILAGKGIGAGSLAAVLTIIGYSVNDTIVIFDRVRENMVLAAKTGSAGKKGASSRLGKASLRDILNLSINETLSRTIITSLTVLFVCLTLWWFGGGAVSDLAYTLMIGVVVGSYSTVFIASPVVALMIRSESSKKGE